MRDKIKWLKNLKRFLTIHHLLAGISVFVMAFSWYFMSDSTVIGAPGDHLLEAFSLDSWSGDQTGTHLTAIYGLILLMISFPLIRVNVIERFKVRWPTVFFYVILIIFAMNRITDAIAVDIKAQLQGLKSIEYIEEGNIFEYQWEDGQLEDFVMVFTLKNHNEDRHKFSIMLDSRWMRKDDEIPIKILNKDGSLAIFELYGRQEKRFVITSHDYSYSDGKKLNNGSGFSSIEELILTNNHEQIKLSDHHYFGQIADVALQVGKTSDVEAFDSLEATYELNYRSYDEEAKIDVILRRVEGHKIIWDKVWSDIMLTELSPYSELVQRDDKLYIEVSGKLYVINQADGRQVFEPVRVGSGEKPVIDEEGNIYYVGFYDPFASKVSASGEIVWQINHLEAYYWPYNLRIEGQSLLIDCEKTDDTSVYDLKISKNTGRLW